MKKAHLRVMAIALCLLLVISLAPPREASAAVPAAPTGLTATVINSNQINLSWNYASGAAYYYLYRSTSYYGSYELISATTSTSYTDTNLSSNTAYYYKVQAYNIDGYSGDSNIASATTSVGTPFSATAIGNNQIQLTWNTISSASYYSIYRSTSYSGTYSHIGTAYSTSFVDGSLSTGTTYYYKFEAVSSYGSIIYYSDIVNATTSTGGTATGPIASTRLYGSNRYATSQAISQSGWTSSYYAIVVSGENYPDALCSAPLAAKYNAPILLTTKDSLNYQTRSELERLKVSKVYLIGGVNVISTATEQSIRNMGISVTRIAGTDRYDTSLQIALTLGDFNQAVIATGENYADALSMAPIAAMKRIPILLTPKDSMSYSLRQYLSNYVRSTYVVGGVNAISPAVYNQLPSPERLSGTNRYKTNIEVIKRFANELNFANCYLATGATFPDALAGAALASLSNSPLFLVSSPLDYATSSYIDEKRSYISKLTAFGGTSVISGTLLNSIANASANTVLSAPTGLTATNQGNNQIYLSWNSVSGATHYYIYRSTSYSGTYSYVTSVTSPWYTDTNLVSNTTYYYKVMAYNSYGSSPYSAIVSATTTYGIPATPTGLSASAQNASQIYLSWNSSANASYYYIYRSTAYNGSYNYVTSVSSTYYTDSGLSPNTTYYYKIMAYNSLGSSSYSSIVSATTTAAGVLPAPTNFTASASGADVNLSWDSVDKAHTYQVLRSTSAGGTYSIIVTTSSTSHKDTPSPAGTYYYKVRALNSSYEVGGLSGYVSATTSGVPAVPAVPTGLAATAKDATADSFPIVLTWTAVPEATKYTVARHTADTGDYEVLNSNVTGTTYTDSDAALLANTTYYYKVLAENAAGSSAYCMPVQVITAPATPSLSAQANSSTQITLSWNEVEGATKYIIYSRQDGSDYTEIVSVNHPTTSFGHTGLTANTKYYYRVEAVRGTLKSYYAEADATTHSEA
jgi:putative cell wall-binding protein/fibronectin type 3 domain-containing protein